MTKYTRQQLEKMTDEELQEIYKNIDRTNLKIKATQGRESDLDRNMAIARVTVALDNQNKIYEAAKPVKTDTLESDILSTQKQLESLIATLEVDLDELDDYNKNDTGDFSTRLPNEDLIREQLRKIEADQKNLLTSIASAEVLVAATEQLSTTQLSNLIANNDKLKALLAKRIALPPPPINLSDEDNSDPSKQPSDSNSNDSEGEDNSDNSDSSKDPSDSEGEDTEDGDGGSSNDSDKEDTKGNSDSKKDKDSDKGNEEDDSENEDGNSNDSENEDDSEDEGDSSGTDNNDENENSENENSEDEDGNGNEEDGDSTSGSSANSPDSVEIDEEDAPNPEGEVMIGQITNSLLGKIGDSLVKRITKADIEGQLQQRVERSTDYFKDIFDSVGSFLSQGQRSRTYHRPSHRYEEAPDANGLIPILPGTSRKTRKARLTIYLDVSGSMGTDPYKIANKLREYAKTLEDTRSLVVTFENTLLEVLDLSVPVYNFELGGGTDINLVLSAIASGKTMSMEVTDETLGIKTMEQVNLKADISVVITDLGGYVDLSLIPQSEQVIFVSNNEYVSKELQKQAHSNIEVIYTERW